MGLSGAMSSAVSGLTAQANVLSMISNNIANADTTGYKTTTASFESILNGSGSDSSSSGGVLVSGKANIGVQGTLTTTSSSTNMAIDGTGFFPVKSTAAGSTETQYTRDGEFTANSSGILVTSSGYELLGYQLDSSGNASGGLTAVDTTVAKTYQQATSTATIAANLPSNAAVGDSYTSSMSVYDSQGTAASSTITWTKTATNTWTAAFSDPVSSTDSTSTLGTVTTSAITVNFNSDGSLASTDPSPPTVKVTWNNGASDSNITLNLGTTGKTDGLTQDSSSATTLSVTPTITQNGVAKGTYSSVSVATDGTVSATYSNGSTVAIYKIPIATFTNQDGLSVSSGGIYTATLASGDATLKTAGEDGAGKIDGSTLESSTTDTTTEFSAMITAQQAYSAASQCMSTSNAMFTTLLNMLK